jgi:hypothetical protein
MRFNGGEKICPVHGLGERAVGRDPYAVFKNFYRLVRAVQMHRVILFNHDPRASALVPRRKRNLMRTEQNLIALRYFEFD